MDWGSDLDETEFNVIDTVRRTGEGRVPAVFSPHGKVPPPPQSWLAMRADAGGVGPHHGHQPCSLLAASAILRP